MKKWMVLVGALLCLLSGTSRAGSQVWVQITTWDGRQITLGDFGFYEGSSWDCLTEYKVHRRDIPVEYNGTLTKLSLNRISVIRNTVPEFTEHFHDLTIELLDGSRVFGEGLAKIVGIVGKDTFGEVHVPGREINTIKFLRPEKRSLSGGGEEE